MSRREQFSVGELVMVGIPVKMTTHTVTVLARNEAGAVLMCSGADIPHDSDVGFAMGCMFIKTDTGAIYYNVGTALIANFDLQGVVTSGSVATADIADDAVTLAKLVNITRGSIIVGGVSAAPTELDAKTSGKILVGDGTDLKSVTVGTDATLAANGALTIAADAITTGKILAANVTLAKLAAGITPSHVVKYAGKITWSGSGASLATTVTGVASTDIVLATIQTAPTQAAYLVSAAPTTDTITLTLSAANTSNQAVIGYQVLRAAA